ncbi:MAG: NADH-quinone oxidoreductase subunit NuoG [Anaerolineales bacterium]|nr:NADH-quinone oxidoreductase subunit NuoG [Anaerolineales bacterium]
MTKPVTLTMDGVQIEVPAGTLIVNAAKMAGVDIPVFCYHPKMEPVGMCRMCLVEIGRPVIDRATGEKVLEEDGSPKIQFSPKLELACATPVSEGMVVLNKSENAKRGRKDILEFLLTSHPLDCPICDKGGECPLQDLTMGFGPGVSRYLYDEKKHLAKQYPLGELIMLDRERCIQCGRCVRFQDIYAEDPVIAFTHRGRSMEIVSYSDPGFDSYWSGNTTDICPVGALTTMDFRFRARPWELRAAASLCTHCAVGCNLTLNVRREAVSGGEWVVKRVMPRQNEEVNEIWICDKGRFGYHYAAQNPERLRQPLVRKNGELEPASWKEALDLIAERFEQAGQGLLTLAGGRLANEDLFNLGKLTKGLGGKTVLYSHMGGGKLTSRVGLTPGSNLIDLGAGSGDEPPDAVLVVGCDLEEEAPLWWLRVRQAARRGAKLIVLNPRRTKLDNSASYVLRYPFGNAAMAVLAMVNALSQKQPDLPESVQALSRDPDLQAAAKAFAEARNALVIYGSEGMGLVESSALAQACANLLLTTNHVGRPNNGLICAWPHANEQGAWELGWEPDENLVESLKQAEALYIAGADPVSDDAAYQPSFGSDKFVVVQDLYLSQTARLADVVLPVQSWIEREGSYTSGERRVQRFYPALPATTALPPKAEAPGVRAASVLTRSAPELEGPQADYAIPALIAERLKIEALNYSNAAVVFAQIGETIPVFAGLTFQKLAEVHEQWPIVGRGDMYYGGTTYENTQGLGVQLKLAAPDAGQPPLAWPQVVDFKLPSLGMMAFPVTRLYDQGSTLMRTELLHQRIGEPYVVLNGSDAGRLKIADGGKVRITFSNTEQSTIVQVRLDNELPERVVLVPRSYGLFISGPTPVEIRQAN